MSVPWWARPAWVSASAILIRKSRALDREGRYYADTDTAGGRTVTNEPTEMAGVTTR